MNWQEKAVEAGYADYCARIGLFRTNERDEIGKAAFRAALRAALPLIEVTPGMQADAESMTDFTSVQGCAYDRDQVREEIGLAVKLALSACAKENP